MPASKWAVIGHRRRADIDRLPGLDRDANTAREVVPELHDPRMRPPPLLDISFDSEVGTLVDDLPAPGADRAAEAGGEIANFAGLAVDLGDGVELLVQHLAGRDPVGLDALVPASVEFSVGVELPGLAREPGQHPAFDRAVIEQQELVSRSGAYRAAREAPIRVSGLPYCASRARSPARTSSIASSGTPAIVAVEVLQLGSQSDPSPWSAAVPAQGSAQPVVLLVRERQHPGKLASRCPGALTA